MEVAGVGPIIGYSVGMIGSERIIFLHCYTREEEQDRWLPVFETLVNGFTYDPGYEFVPGAGGFWRNVLGGTRAGR